MTMDEVLRVTFQRPSPIFFTLIRYLACDTTLPQSILDP